MHHSNNEYGIVSDLIDKPVTVEKQLTNIMVFKFRDDSAPVWQGN